jgi:hypothetical protein
MQSAQMNAISTFDGPIYLAGERVDGRLGIAKRYRELANDLAAQLSGFLAPSERLMLQRAAALAVLCEQDEARLLDGKDIDQENYRRNASALRGALIGLGVAKKSRDITKRESRLFDSHAAAVLDIDESDD